MYILYLPVTLGLTFWASKIITKEYKYRISINFPYDKTDITWNKRVFILFPLYGFITGIMAGMLGIGGGLFIAPLLLFIGLNPISVTTTSNFLMLFTASSTTIQYSLHVIKF
jgi:uncharacterized membrane protein YfcA